MQTSAVRNRPRSPIKPRPAAEPAAAFAGSTREARFLLACASQDIDPQWQAAVRAIGEEPLSWPLLVQSASFNQLLPQLVEGAHQLDPAAVPPKISEWLNLSGRSCALRNLHLTSEMLRVARLFENAGILAIFYKGPLLGLDLYGGLATRQFRDLDLLLRRQDIVPAARLLMECGYQPGRPLGELMLEDDIESELSLVHPQLGVEVELHWCVLPRRHAAAFDEALIWSQIEERPLMGVNLPTFAPDLLFLVLCLHGGHKHQWAQLRMIRDIGLFLARHDELDWDSILRRARAAAIKPSMLLGAHLASSLLGAPLPEQLARPVHRHRHVLAARAGLVHGRLFREDTGLPCYREWRNYLEQFHARGPLPLLGAGPFGYCRSLLEPEWEDRELLPMLPPGLGFLLLLARPWRLWRRHGSGLLDRAFAASPQ